MTRSASCTRTTRVVSVQLGALRRPARCAAVWGGPRAFRRPRRPPGRPDGVSAVAEVRRRLPWTDGGMDAAADGDDDEVVCLLPLPTRSAVAPRASADSSLCSGSAGSAATSRRGTSPPPPRRAAAEGCPTETSDDEPICLSPPPSGTRSGTAASVPRSPTRSTPSMPRTAPPTPSWSRRNTHTITTSAGPGVYPCAALLPPSPTVDGALALTRRKFSPALRAARAPRGWALRQSGQQDEHTTTTAAYAACGRTHS